MLGVWWFHILPRQICIRKTTSNGLHKGLFYVCGYTSYTSSWNSNSAQKELSEFDAMRQQNQKTCLKMFNPHSSRGPGVCWSLFQSILRPHTDRWSHTHSQGVINLWCMMMDCGRRLEWPEKPRKAIKRVAFEPGHSPSVVVYKST